MPAPTPSQYVLGRNTILWLTSYADNGSVLTSRAKICISDGSIDLSTDTFEINNNCNSGWKLKFAALTGGTMSFNGFIATASVSASAFIGKRCYIELEGYDATGSQPFNFESEAWCTAQRLSFDVNDSMRCEMSFELTGAPAINSGYTVASSLT